ncbi:MAG: class I SAM-dependent methyltransferase [Pseudomonadota bacterium]
MEFKPETFGAIYADEYDDEHDPGTTAAAVALLNTLAAGRRTLELAVGTGRVALPLAAEGLDIVGIEASAAMIARLREKPGGERLPVVEGDMSRTRAEGRFGFAYLIFNTLFNLTSQEDQVRCFATVAAQLEAGGEFLIETLVPAHLGLESAGGQTLRTLAVDQERLEFEGACHDPVAQIVDFQRVRLTADGVRLRPLRFRYATPGEIDLMARLAGFVRIDRWSNWQRSAFTADSRSHLTLYRKAP